MACKLKPLVGISESFLLFKEELQKKLSKHYKRHRYTTMKVPGII